MRAMAGTAKFPAGQTVDLQDCEVVGVPAYVWSSPQRRFEVRAKDNVELPPDADFVAIPAGAPNGTARVQLPRSSLTRPGKAVTIKNESGNRKASISLLVSGNERLEGYSRWILRGTYFSVRLYCTGSSWFSIGELPGRGFDGIEAAGADSDSD